MKQTPQKPPVATGVGERMEKAFQSLPPAKYVQMLKYAEWRMRSLPNKAHGRDAEDLFQEAVVATLEGRRVWPESVDLFHQLTGAMRSISSCWRAKAGEEYAESELAAGDNPSPLDSVAAASDPEQALAALELLEQITVLFSHDITALVVLDYLIAGHTAKEIQQLLGISDKEIAAKLRWIGRKLLTLRDREPEPVS